jgi:hypothetical protein
METTLAQHDMSTPETWNQAVPGTGGAGSGEIQGNSTVPGQGNGPNVDSPKGNVNQLSPEEQMALFEQELKDTDWGHQPC